MTDKEKARIYREENPQRGNKVLLIGSGKGASAARDWDLSEWVVCAINNAWSIVPDFLEYHIRSGDWIPADGNRPPAGFYGPTRRNISFREYDSEAQREKYGGQGVGIGSTMFFNAAYWILGSTDPSLIGFIGCSMSYPNGEANTFYGSGTADPLRFSKRYLRDRFATFASACKKAGVDTVNFGGEGLMPYERTSFLLSSLLMVPPLVADGGGSGLVF